MRSSTATLTAIFAAIFLAMTGCQTSFSFARAADAAPATVSQQLIIKLKADTLNCDAADITRLSREAQVPLEYIRAMSGDACVVRQTADSREHLEQGQQTLRQHPALEWLELDARMKAN